MTERPYIDRIDRWEVIDGDTIRCWVDLGYRMIHRIHLRLLGVDTPELRGKAHRAAGQVAKQAVIDWLLSQPQDVLLIESVQMDKYAGRCNGDILSGNERLSVWLLSKGYAQPTSKTGKRPEWTKAELERIVDGQ